VETKLDGACREEGRLTHRYRSVERWPSVSGTRPERRLLERSSVWSRGSAPSSGGSRPVTLLFCSNLDTKMANTSSSALAVTPLILTWFSQERKMDEWVLIDISRQAKKKWSYTCSRCVRLAILPDRVPDKPWLGAPLKRQHQCARVSQLNGAR
jgi:hypothetical protein